MMMKMLEAGGMTAMSDGIREADVDNPKGYYELEAVKKTKEDPSWLEDAHGKVVKMVYSLLYDLTDGHEYRVVFMRRNIDEILASQKKMLDRLGAGSGGGVSEAEMKALFDKQIRACKEFLSEDSRFQFIEVLYNDLLEDPEPTLAEVDRFLGRSLDVSAMTTVVDQKLYRNRHCALGEMS